MSARLLLGLLGVLLVLEARAAAQTAGVALSAQDGVLLPAVTFGPARVYVGALDIFLSPRVALRPGALWSEPASGDLSQRRVGLTWDVIRNWELGRWRGFVSAGASMHLFQTRVKGRALGDEDDLNFGVEVGGGAEVRLSRAIAVTGELTYFAIEQGRLSQSPSAVSVRGGLKRYF